MALEWKSQLLMSALGPRGCPVQGCRGCQSVGPCAVTAERLGKAPALRFKFALGALFSVNCGNSLIAT